MEESRIGVRGLSLTRLSKSKVEEWEDGQKSEEKSCVVSLWLVSRCGHLGSWRFAHNNVASRIIELADLKEDKRQGALLAVLWVVDLSRGCLGVPDFAVENRGDGTSPALRTGGNCDSSTWTEDAKLAKQEAS